MGPGRGRRRTREETVLSSECIRPAVEGVDVFDPRRGGGEFVGEQRGHTIRRASPLGLLA